MTLVKTSFSKRTSLRRRGQSAVVALLVLLLLGFVGALFVTIVFRNIVNARRANRVVTADYYARAGISFADAQLTYSPDGADWRPPLQYQLAPAYQPPSGTREGMRYAAAATALPSLTALPQSNDPDREYLEAGFTRYNTGAGRFLLRLTYDPINVAGTAVPPGRYIKIEAIGREGVIDPIDPTTYTNNRSSDRLQAVQVAYKPIGITDYARFETNPENRSDTANLGVLSQFSSTDPDGLVTPGAYDFTGAVDASNNPVIQLYPVITTYGAPDAYTKTGGVLLPNPTAGTVGALTDASIASGLLPGGGSFHSNMSVRFFGKNIFYLNDAGALAPLFQDTVEVAGNLLLDSYNPKGKLDNSDTANYQIADAILEQADATNKAAKTYVAPSNATPTDAGGGFSTEGGLIRDGSTQTDINGSPRGINRLEPPLMDATEPASNLPRYKALAMTSPPRIDPSTGSPYTGASDSIAQNGYGQAIYINNVNDVQHESQAIGGGSTLAGEWLNRTNQPGVDTFGGWSGDLYDPLGVNITLGEQTTTIKGAPATFAGISLTRFDSGSQSQTFAWTDPSGNAISGQAADGTTASQMVVSYDSLSASNDLTATPNATNPNNDVLIYAEGNVRVHGIVSPNEGSAGSPKTIPRHVTIVTDGTAYIDGNLLKGDPDSSITVLAHDYVCVNTTQFLAGPQPDSGSGAVLPLSDPANQTSYYSLTPSSGTLTQELNFGLAGGTVATAYSGTKLALYVAGEGEGGQAAQIDFNIFGPTGTNLFTNNPIIGPASRLTAPLGIGLNALTPLDVGQVRVNLDPGAENAGANANFHLQRIAVLPDDIRIEAVLYAQTRSFFVIPGDWFNTDASDTLDAFTKGAKDSAGNVLRTPGVRPNTTDPRFPFFGQPIDMKITIDGAVSEARPADIAAQNLWMLKWGWIPQYHGSLTGAYSTTAETAGHTATAMPAIGLQIIYNPQAGYPYHPSSTGVGYYLRSDLSGRPLPFAPRLPVSTGLLYAGESGEPPLLQ